MLYGAVLMALDKLSQKCLINSVESSSFFKSSLFSSSFAIKNWSLTFMTIPERKNLQVWNGLRFCWRCYQSASAVSFSIENSSADKDGAQ